MVGTMIRFGLKVVGLGVLLVVCFGIGAGIAQLRGLAQDPNRLAAIFQDAWQSVAGGPASAGVEVSSSSKEER